MFGKSSSDSFGSITQDKIKCDHCTMGHSWQPVSCNYCDQIRKHDLGFCKSTLQNAPDAK